MDKKHICSTDVSLITSAKTHPTGENGLDFFTTLLFFKGFQLKKMGNELYRFNPPFLRAAFQDIRLFSLMSLIP